MVVRACVRCAWGCGGCRLYVVGRLSLPRFLVAASFQLWFSVLAVGEVRCRGARSWGAGWRCFAGGVFGGLAGRGVWLFAGDTKVQW